MRGGSWRDGVNRISTRAEEAPQTRDRRGDGRAHGAARALPPDDAGELVEARDAGADRSEMREQGLDEAHAPEISRRCTSDVQAVEHAVEHDDRAIAAQGLELGVEERAWAARPGGEHGAAPACARA